MTGGGSSGASREPASLCRKGAESIYSPLVYMPEYIVQCLEHEYQNNCLS